MKRLLILLLTCLTIASCISQKKYKKNDTANCPKHFIVLMNPTVSNIKTFRFLRENKIFELADNIGFIGLYHKKQRYDFELSKKYIDNNKLPITLVSCDSMLSIENIYTTNGCDSLLYQIFRKSIGVFFLGGPDIPSACFGEKSHLMASTTDPYRNFLEIHFLNRLLSGYQDKSQVPWIESNPEYIIIGFCLGMQTMNCATGGTMIQDIPMNVYNLSSAEDILSMPDAQHKNYNSYFDYDNILTNYVFHKIIPVGENYFTELLKENTAPFVLSSHHQAINEIGKDMEVAATSIDKKIIEAIIHAKYPHVMGVQFHPEHTSLYRTESEIKINFGEQSSNYLHLYKGDKGETFHREFWKMISNWFLKANSTE